MFDIIVEILNPQTVRFCLFLYIAFALVFAFKKWKVYKDGSLTLEELLYEYIFPLGIWLVFGFILVIFSNVFNAEANIELSNAPPLDPQISENAFVRRI